MVCAITVLIQDGAFEPQLHAPEMPGTRIQAAAPAAWMMKWDTCAACLGVVIAARVSWLPEDLWGVRLQDPAGTQSCLCMITSFFLLLPSCPGLAAVAAKIAREPLDCPPEIVVITTGAVMVGACY